MFNEIIIKYKLVFLAMLAVLLSACGPSESSKEDAYDAGWRSAWNEKCRDIPAPLMMPSEYDDSKGSGELVGYYRSGIYDAKADKDLCK
jgi:hypothetical protein